MSFFTIYLHIVFFVFQRLEEQNNQINLTVDDIREKQMKAEERRMTVSVT